MNPNFETFRELIIRRVHHIIMLESNERRLAQIYVVDAAIRDRRENWPVCGAFLLCV